jgi:uncharacterized protein with GYD domain
MHLTAAKLHPSPEVLDLWRNAQASQEAAATWLSVVLNMSGNLHSKLLLTLPVFLCCRRCALT